ncbi:helix-turn-helix transcriptional regulator [Prauserella rugosa]|uniref:Helix-turn-helix protein n=1 Tax=Prauserella rugosa TaxID=43354 RepID=A0A660CL93_9PSEU|nr:helix-turn-helix transcriptional regulator [Prauserella rugosa]KMS90060.1 XRE family transcriptional regulator [Streptomyces regensis]TWH22403.1 helix-turn-helix protein [Prauserella rugosa]
MDRTALADFLRSRREGLRPEHVGLTSGPRRRATGLRREEVAALASMSTDYYTRLEQRRGPQPSEQLLGALARTLRLTAHERDYLFQVAGRNVPPPGAGADHVAPSLLRVLDQLSDTPAMIISELGETLVQNRMAGALFGDRTRFTGLARSEYYRWFTDPAERRCYPERDHERQSRAHVANLRAAYGSLGPRSRAGQLVEALLRESAEFAELWERHEVGRRFADHKTLRHPEMGDIAVDCQVLFTEDRSQALLVLTAAPTVEDALKLTLLDVVGHQRFGPEDHQPDVAHATSAWARR